MREALGWLEVGRQHATDWTLIGGAVGVSAYLAIYGTDVQTSATADALQDFAMLGAGENLAASVVEQHDVKFFGPIHFIRSSRAAYQCAVGGDGLAGSRGR